MLLCKTALHIYVLKLKIIHQLYFFEQINEKGKINIMSDKELIRENRKYLDEYYSRNINEGEVSTLTKSLRVLKAFGISGLIKKINKRALQKSSYKSDTFEENCEPVDMGNKKIAVYTAITGKYDTLYEPLYKSPDCDYIIYTDMELPENTIWQKREMPKDSYYLSLGNYQRAKYFKIFPDRLFPEYDYSIWVDGNITIVGDLAPFVERMGEKWMAEFKHPNNDCVYQEAFSIVSQGKSKGRDVKAQINSYKKEGFPEKFGLFENSFIVRKHNHPECIDLMNSWWEQMEKYTWRDQLSLSYTLWKNGYDIDTIQVLGDCWRWNPRLRQNNHLK